MLTAANHRILSTALLWLVVVLFILGAFLLGLNMMGWFIPLRSAEVYGLKNGQDVSISYEEALPQVDRRSSETETEYIYRLHGLISQSMGHYWEPEGIDRFALRIPPWENYILWADSFFYPNDFRRYEIADYRLALQRGVGLCSQHAMLINSILLRNGIKSKIINANGHVVATAKADGKWYVLDADYEVILPYSFAEVEKNPKLIEAYYKINTQLIEDIFGTAADNREYDSFVSYHTPRLVKMEQDAYFYKWVIPIALMAPFGMALVFRVLAVAIRKYSSRT